MLEKCVKVYGLPAIGLVVSLGANGRMYADFWYITDWRDYRARQKARGYHERILPNAVICATIDEDIDMNKDVIIDAFTIQRNKRHASKNRLVKRYGARRFNAVSDDKTTRDAKQRKLWKDGV